MPPRCIDGTTIGMRHGSLGTPLTILKGGGADLWWLRKKQGIGCYEDSISCPGAPPTEISPRSVPNANIKIKDVDSDGMGKPTHLGAYPPAPEYSQLPEVAAGWSGTEAPELASADEAAKAARGFGASSWTPPQEQSSPLAATRSPLPIAIKSEPAGSGYPPSSAAQDGAKPRRTTVLILSILVGVLAAAVVGLATATGMMARRASNAESATPQAIVNGTVCPAVTATATTTTTATVVSATGTNVPTSAPIADVSNGCSAKNEKISGTTYTTQIFGKVSFIRYCNAQPKQFPIYGMLTLDFEACMDACAAWSAHGATVLGKGNSNSTCGGVRFVPAWTDRAVAYKRNARGNCFLQSAPQTADSLNKPDLAGDVTCHAAILVEKL